MECGADPPRTVSSAGSGTHEELVTCRSTVLLYKIARGGRVGHSSTASEYRYLTALSSLHYTVHSRAQGMSLV